MSKNIKRRDFLKNIGISSIVLSLISGLRIPSRSDSDLESVSSPEFDEWWSEEGEVKGVDTTFEDGYHSSDLDNLSLGQETFVRSANRTGQKIYEGQGVVFTWELDLDSEHIGMLIPTIQLADAQTRVACQGRAAEDIFDGAEGYIQTSGLGIESAITMTQSKPFI